MVALCWASALTTIGARYDATRTSSPRSRRRWQRPHHSSGHKASTSSIDAPLLAAAEEHAFELCSLAKGGVSTRRKQQTETSPEVNWAANVHYNAKDVREPATIRELQKIIASAQNGIRMLGSRHSFSRVADCRGELISASRLAAAGLSKSMREGIRQRTGRIHTPN